jgi:hypothetical protein
MSSQSLKMKYIHWIEIVVFWVDAFSVIDDYKSFERTYCLHCPSVNCCTYNVIIHKTHYKCSNLIHAIKSSDSDIRYAAPSLSFQYLLKHYWLPCWNAMVGHHQWPSHLRFFQSISLQFIFMLASKVSAVISWSS